VRSKKQREAEPREVFASGLPPIQRKIPRKLPTGIPFGILLVLPASCSAKTAKHPTSWIFLGILGAEDAALLTQGKDDKQKITRKDG